MSNIPNNPEDVKAIKIALDEISEALSEINTQRIQINEIAKALEDKYKIPAKTFRKVANLYHRQAVTQFENEAEEIKDMYKTIIG
jgi:Transcriptional regulator DsbA